MSFPACIESCSVPSFGYGFRQDSLSMMPAGLVVSGLRDDLTSVTVRGKAIMQDHLVMMGTVKCMRSKQGGGDVWVMSGPRCRRLEAWIPRRPQALVPALPRMRASQSSRSSAPPRASAPSSRCGPPCLCPGLVCLAQHEGFNHTLQHPSLCSITLNAVCPGLTVQISLCSRRSPLSPVAEEGLVSSTNE